MEDKKFIDTTSSILQPNDAPLRSKTRQSTIGKARIASETSRWHQARVTAMVPRGRRKVQRTTYGLFSEDLSPREVLARLRLQQSPNYRCVSTSASRKGERRPGRLTFLTCVRSWMAHIGGRQTTTHAWNIATNPNNDSRYSYDTWRELGDYRKVLAVIDSHTSLQTFYFIFIPHPG